jgi:hypothetical protein
MPRSRPGDLFAGGFTGQRESPRGVVAWIALVLAVLSVLFFGGEYVQRYIAYRAHRHPSRPPLPWWEPARAIVLNTLYEVPTPSRDERLIATGLPLYDLRIASGNLRDLQRMAEAVSARYVAEGVPLTSVPAQFWLDGNWLPIKVRLRGTYAYHYLKKHPSLRLEFPKHRLFRGQDNLNLLEPYDKDLTADVTATWEARQHGLLTWDDQFVLARVNGDLLGLYQEIEHFGRGMIDRNGRSEGFIFSGHGQLFGKEGPAFDKASRGIELVTRCYTSPGAPAPAHCRDWGFVRDYLDTDRWAWAAALTTLLKSRHAWAPDNLRLYWDPSRGRFEPIPWDYSSYRLDPERDPEGEADLTGYVGQTLLDVPEFRRLRDERLWVLATERVPAMIDHAERLFETLREALVLDLRHPGFKPDAEKQALYVETLRRNAEWLRTLFERHGLEARYWREEGALTVELANRGKSFLRVEALRVGAGEMALEPPVIVDGLWRGTPGTARFRVAVPPGASVAGLVVRNQVTGTPLREESIRLLPGTGPAPEPPRTAAPSPLPIALDNVRVGPSRVVFGPGRVTLRGTLDIPATHEVVFAPGLELEMGPEAALMIYGDLTSVGTGDAPIRVFGSRSDDAWGGLFVQGTRVDPARVHLEHTIIEGGTGGQNERTWFTGAFAVHDGEVTLRASQFRGARVEDAVNLKNARVLLEGNVFAGTLSDALDCDFCEGRIAGNRFTEIGGDAIDLSGSRVVVEQNDVERCGDKGVSVGERTEGLLAGNRIRGCPTGIAVKDLSQATIRGGVLAELGVGIALYVKKPTFGPSRATVEDVLMEQVATRFLKDSDCALELRDASG